MKSLLVKLALGIALWTIGAGAGMPYAFGTTLIFEPASGGSFGNYVELPQGYGNRVGSTIQDGFKYTLDGGRTPNVMVQHSSGSLPQILTWGMDFGDLQNVVTSIEPSVFEMKLVADPGYKVTLNSFDMACWPHLNYTINSVQVADNNGKMLFAQNNVLIYGDPTGPQHKHFTFSGVTANALVIRFDATNVDCDDVGIDNINFSQSRKGLALPWLLLLLN
jgi:hypothetical protein